MPVRPAALIAASLAALLALSPGSAAPVPVAPRAAAFRVGALQLWALADESNVVANDGKVFGSDVGPAAVAGTLRDAGAPTDRVTLGVDALLVRMPGHVVLIDTGLGPKVGGVLLASLARAGVAPAGVTDVLVTHSHGDHVGGLLTGAGALAFPNATIRMSAAEWAFLRGKGDQAALVAAIAPRVQPFAPGVRVLPGIASVSLPGHTPGHVGYRILSGPDHLLDIGDTAHSSIVSLAHPGWTIGYDTDAAQGRAEREATLARLAASHERVFAPHFPFPGVGRIVAVGAGYAFRPDLN